MAFDRPSLQTLLSRVQADIEIELPGADARLRRSAEYAFARAVAGLSHGKHGRLDFFFRQGFPDTAVAEFLDRWARIWLGPDARNAPTKATGAIDVTGVDTTVIPIGTEWQRPGVEGVSDPVVWVSTAAATITGGVATVAVEGAEFGAAGNADAGVSVSLVNPVTGVDSDATVSGPAGITGGNDLESDAALLRRLLLRIQRPTTAGGPSFYEQVALAVPGVTRAWERGGASGPGTVDLYFVCDDLPVIIPTPGKIAEVQSAIDAVKPIWVAAVFVKAPDGIPLDITVSGLTPDTAEIRAAVEAEHADLVTREAEPGVTIFLSKIREATSRAQGEEDHTIVSPVADVTHTSVQIPIVGTTTFI